jgi:hypothetical protein
MVRQILRVLLHVVLGIVIAGPILAIVVPLAPNQLGPSGAVFIMLLCVGVVMFIARRDRPRG